VDHKPPRFAWLPADRDQWVLYVITLCLVVAVGVRAAMNRYATGHEARKIGSTADVSYRVNINQADVAELDLLPGVGGTLAGRIVEHRRKKGPFLTVDGLSRVPGFTAARVAKLRPFIEACGNGPGGEPSE
jgi:competence ComEA-like helix-hairpin-helix protein